jgi:hypothetical protein
MTAEYHPLITCFAETQDTRDLLALKGCNMDKIALVTITQRHELEGYFTEGFSGPLTVYRCLTCGARRVYGKVADGPPVKPIERWSKLAVYPLEAGDDGR